MSASLGPDRRWRNRPLVRERDQERVLWLWSVLVVIVLTAIPAGAYLIYQNECLRLSYEISALQDEYDKLLEKERRLKVERAELDSLSRIEDWARHERRLIRAAGEVVHVLPRQSVEPTPLLARSRESLSTPRRPRRAE